MAKNTNSANKSVGNVINVVTNPKCTEVALAKRAGCTWVDINGIPFIPLGGTPEEQEKNLECIRFMVNNCDEQENGAIIAQQCAALTCVMADLEKVSLDDIISFRNSEYAIDSKLKQVYSENGQLVVDMLEAYPELANVKLTDKSIRAILISELNKAIQPDTKENEGLDERIDIKTKSKLSVLDTIKGLRALGMGASWYDVNGISQPMPICYNGAEDLEQFKKIVEDSLNNDKDYLEVILMSCKINEHELNPDDEVLLIDGVNCIIDYDKKEIWDESISQKIAALDDIDCDLPNEAVKALLVERAKEAIAAGLEEDFEYDDEYYDDEDSDF